MTFVFADIPEIVLYYTPVTSDLHTAAEKLGDLLHVLENRHPLDDPWWDATKQRLIKLYRGAWVACQGDLVCPPLLNKHGNAVGTLEFIGKKNEPLMKKIEGKNEQVVLHMKYLTSVPINWTPDL
jgi:hypothetical protein